MRFFLHAGIGLGAVLALLALADVVRTEITQPEKAAYYIMGHWLDAFWQVQLPALILGLFMIFCCVQLLPHNRR